MQPRLPIQILPLKSQVLLFNKIRFARLLQRVAPHPISRSPDVVPISFGQLLRQAVEVVVVVADFLQRADAVDSRQGFVAFVFVDVQAGLTVFMLLQQPQAIPHEQGLTQRITIAVMLGFFNAPAQWVIGHPDHAAVFIAYFNQSAFGVVGKALYAAFGAALFDHSAEAVVAVTLVLVGQQFVMHHQPGTGLGAVEQVGGDIVGEGFALALYVVLGGDDAAGGVVVQQFAVFVFPAADQVVGGVVLEVLLRRRWHQRGLAGVAALACAQAAAAVVFAAGAELALGAQHFAVQAVAFEVADDVAVEVDLVQVAAAVVQAI